MGDNFFGLRADVGSKEYKTVRVGAPAAATLSPSFGLEWGRKRESFGMRLSLA